MSVRSFILPPLLVDVGLLISCSSDQRRVSFPLCMYSIPIGPTSTTVSSNDWAATSTVTLTWMSIFCVPSIVSRPGPVNVTTEPATLAAVGVACTIMLCARPKGGKTNAERPAIRHSKLPDADPEGSIATFTASCENVAVPPPVRCIAPGRACAGAARTTMAKAAYAAARGRSAPQRTRIMLSPFLDLRKPSAAPARRRRGARPDCLVEDVELRAARVRRIRAPPRSRRVVEVGVALRGRDSLEDRIRRASGQMAADHEDARAPVGIGDLEHRQPAACVGLNTGDPVDEPGRHRPRSEREAHEAGDRVRAAVAPD